MNIALRLHLFLIAAVIAASSVYAQDGSWTYDGGVAGNNTWTNSSSWSGGTIANGSNATATFGNVITADRVITLGGNRTIGNITASDTSHNYTLSGDTLTLDRTDATAPQINVTQSGRTLTISSVIAGNDGLAKVGSGTLTISTTPTYTGATILNGGALNVSGLGATPLSSSSGITFSGNSTLDLATVNQGTPSITVNNGVTASVRTGISGSGALTYTIPSLSGNGTLSADNPGGTGQGKTFIFSDLSAFTGVLQMNLTGASLDFRVSNLNDAVANNIRFAGNGGNIGSNSPNRFNYVGSAGLTLTNRAIEYANGAGAGLLINNNGTSSSSLIINSNLAVTAAGAKTLQFGGTNTGGNSTFAGAINDGTGAVISLSKINSNTWSLTNASNGFTGAITLGSSSALTTSAGTLNYASAGGGNAITINQSTVSPTLNYTGFADKTMSGAINAAALTSGTLTLGSTGSGAVNYSNNASLGSAGSGNKNLVLSGTNTGNNTLAGQWVNNTGGAATLTKNGVGKWILTNTNSFTGATTISAGTLQLGNGGITGALTGTASITNNGSLIINRSNDFTQATDLNNRVIGGSGSFTQAGAGNTTLSLVNTYNGTTTVNAGTLAVTGTGSINSTSGIALSGGQLQYNSSVGLTAPLTFTSGTLGGTAWTGSTLNNLTIGANRTISPGNSPGTASTVDQAWASGGNYTWEINDATGTVGTDPGWDLLSGTGNLTITANSTSQFNILITSLTLGNVSGNATNFVSSGNYTWRIADFASDITTFDATAFNLNLAAFTNNYNGTWGIARGDSPGISGGDASQVYLTYVAVPEPATIALLCSAVGILGIRLARRRKA